MAGFKNLEEGAVGGTATSDIDMSTNIITNIGNTGTDFVATTGALNLAGDLTMGSAKDIILVGDGQIRNSSQVLELGTGGTTGHTLGAGDTYITGTAEIDGTLWCDGQLVVANQTTFQNTALVNGGINLAFGGGAATTTQMLWNAAQTPDTMVITAGTTGRSIVIIEGGDAAFDFAHALQTNPTLFIHSAAQSTTQWLGLTHDGTNAIVDTGAGTVKVTNAELPTAALTAGTMTVTNSAYARKVITRFDWTNAMVAAIGAVTTGEVAICTLPAKTLVTRCILVIKTAETALAGTFTVSVGRTGAAYIDFLTASDGKAVANTVYGDAQAEIGADLKGTAGVGLFDSLPSYTGTTVVNAQFISSVGNLSTALASTGTIYLETMLLP